MVRERFGATSLCVVGLAHELRGWQPARATLLADTLARGFDKPLGRPAPPWETRKSTPSDSVARVWSSRGPDTSRREWIDSVASLVAASRIVRGLLGRGHPRGE
jgi:hypothetical protein